MLSKRENIGATNSDRHTSGSGENKGAELDGNKSRIETVENKKGFEKGGYLIGNSNTGKLHSPECRAVKMMKVTHKVPTNGAHFKPCKWCYAMGETKTSTLDDYRTARDEADDIEICTDSKIEHLFQNVECGCGSTEGIIKMYPHSGGVRLLNREGKWWIYRECYSCGYQLSLNKAIQRRRE